MGSVVGPVLEAALPRAWRTIGLSTTSTTKPTIGVGSPPTALLLLDAASLAAPTADNPPGCERIIDHVLRLLQLANELEGPALVE